MQISVALPPVRRIGAGCLATFAVLYAVACVDAETAAHPGAEENLIVQEAENGITDAFDVNPLPELLQSAKVGEPGKKLICNGAPYVQVPSADER